MTALKKEQEFTDTILQSQDISLLPGFELCDFSSEQVIPLASQVESASMYDLAAIARWRQSIAHQQDIYAMPINETSYSSENAHILARMTSRSSDQSSLDLNLKLGIEGKPYSYAQMITYAIIHSPDGKLTLSEIYEWCLENFPYFKKQDNAGWKNSIRHNLSLNKSFVKIPRPINEPGKGAYWSLSKESLDTGTARSQTRARQRSQSALEPLQTEVLRRSTRNGMRRRANTNSAYPYMPCPSAVASQMDQAQAHLNTDTEHRSSPLASHNSLSSTITSTANVALTPMEWDVVSPVSDSTWFHRQWQEYNDLCTMDYTAQVMSLDTLPTDMSQPQMYDVCYTKQDLLQHDNLFSEHAGALTEGIDGSTAYT